MLIVDSQDLHDAVSRNGCGNGCGNGCNNHSQQNPETPQPLAFADADVQITTPFGTYELNSSKLSRASEFFEMSMSERWNRDSSPERDPADGVRFRYWLPLDGYIVDRNRINYKKTTSELMLNAQIIDNLLRSIYDLPVDDLSFDSCSTLIEAADAYDCVPSVTKLATEYWSSILPAELAESIRMDPWLFLLNSFQICNSKVFDSALAHCVGIWHALPHSQQRLLDSFDPCIDSSIDSDDVLWMLDLPDVLQTLILDSNTSLRKTQDKIATGLERIAQEEDKSGLSALDLELDASWESSTAFAERLSRRVTRSFIVNALADATKGSPGTAFRRLHSGIQLMPDEFFACAYFEMSEHISELQAVSPAYCEAMREIADKFKDPDLNLQVHRFHNGLREFQIEIAKIVEPLAVDRTQAEGKGGEEHLLCAGVKDGVYPWRPTESKKRRPGSNDELRRTRRANSEDILFIKGTAVC